MNKNIIFFCLIYIVIGCLIATSYHLDGDAKTFLEYIHNQGEHLAHQDFAIYDRIIGGMIGVMIIPLVVIFKDFVKEDK